MISKIRNDEQGFTLIELLVVILIIGILAAIALPVFLGQQKKGQDASAKSDSRNAVSHVESCYADEQNYANCGTASAAMADAKLPATVSIDTAAPVGGFTVSALSKSGTTFKIAKDGTGAYTRTCDKAGTGGCKSDGTW